MSKLYFYRTRTEYGSNLINLTYLTWYANFCQHMDATVPRGQSWISGSSHWQQAEKEWGFVLRKRKTVAYFKFQSEKHLTAFLLRWG